MTKKESYITKFIEAAELYSRAIPLGDHNAANKANRKALRLAQKIYELNEEENLMKYLFSNDEGVRLCVASILIKKYPATSVKVLRDIVAKDNIYSLLAKIGLDIWAKGRI